MLGMVMTMTAIGFEWSFPEVDVGWGEEALVAVVAAAELPEADTDLHPGDLNTESLFQVSLEHAFTSVNC